MAETKTYAGKCAIQSCDNCDTSQHVHVTVTTEASKGDCPCGLMHTLISDFDPDDDEQGALMEGFVRQHMGPFALGLLASDEEMAEMLPELYAAHRARESGDIGQMIEAVEQMMGDDG